MNTLQTPDTFPRPTDKVVLYDVDETLIGTDYQVTDPGIFPAIQEAQDAGWTVGLSSDTPYATLVERATKFGIKDGPLIAEKGGKVAHGNQTIEPVPGIGAAFLTSRHQIAEHLSDHGVVVWRGNPGEALHKTTIGKPGDTVLLINERRQYSMGFYVRRVDADGTMVKDAGLTDEIAATMEPFMPPYDDLDHDKNHDYGIYIVGRQLVTKRLGTQALMEGMGLTQVAMVGNSRADYIGSDIALHYAVGNAHADFKAVANYVASEPLTTGAIEILRNLYAA